MTDFYTRLAKYYDKMYSLKDYAKESQVLQDLIQQYKTSPGNRLLDVGCGTGGHIEHLRDRYDVTGFDLSEAILEVAREKFEDVTFIQGNMVSMDLGMEFDVITSLFGSIGYLTTLKDLTGAIESFSRHIKRGGVLLIEPFVTEETVHPDTIGMICLDLPDIKIARVNTSKVKGSIVYLNFNFLISTKDGVEHFVDPSPMGIFKRQTFVDLMETNGFSVEYLEPDPSMRGLFVGMKQ